MLSTFISGDRNIVNPDVVKTHKQQIIKSYSFLPLEQEVKIKDHQGPNVETERECCLNRQ